MNQQPELMRVLRPIQGEGERVYAIGEIVDVTEWLYTRQLTERRYLGPAPGATAPSGPLVEHEPERVPSARRGAQREL